jgi:tyrosine phenol-lyase
MTSRWLGVKFSVPYEIAAVRPLRQTTLDERQEALRAAHSNTELIPQDLIYLDLSTDSGVSSLSTTQLSALAGAKFVESGMGLAAEGSRSFGLLAEQVQRIFGFPYLVPTTQGRSAERLWTKINVKPGGVVAGNMLFPSTRVHIEMNGAKIIDVIGDSAHDLTSEDHFKGNLDLEKLSAAIREHGADKISCICGAERQLLRWPSGVAREFNRSQSDCGGPQNSAFSRRLPHPGEQSSHQRKRKRVSQSHGSTNCPRDL